MADQVEQVMQEMVPELDDLKRKRIFDEVELKQIIKRRRDFEYLLHRSPSKPQDYLGYVQYEVALECLRQRRSKALHWRRKTLSDYAGINRMHSIFNRGLAKFKADVRLWYQHADFCLRSGSSKILSKVLMKAVKYHPREVHFWLLAADRELKLGHIKAARALLLRGIRFSPSSPKLWGEFVRLEAQVARNLCNLRLAKVATEATSGDAFSTPTDGEGATKQPTSQGDVWAPVRLIFRRSLARLDGSPAACVAFLVTATRCVSEAITAEPTSDPSSSSGADGLPQWQRELWAAVAERRPGMETAGTAWAEAPEEVAVQLWELWCAQERTQGRGWRGIARAVVAHAPLAAVRHCAHSLGNTARLEGTSSKVVLKTFGEFTASQRVAGDDETALAVLEAMEPSISFAEVQQHASMLLATRAEMSGSAACSEPCVRLRLLALSANGIATEPKELKAVLREASNLTGTYAAQFFALATSHQAPTIEGRVEFLEPLLLALDRNASPRLLVETFLTQALLDGVLAFSAAADRVLAIGAKLWDAPKLRAELLDVVLDAELRVLPPGDASIEKMRANFEDLLTLLHNADPAKVDCWIKYIAFVQRAAHYCSGTRLPSSTTLHWRAMRSVVDQELYTERSQQLQLEI